ncbi:MAG: hypothetical protein IPI53_13175 [Saprospiraceae bacterium]|nr:hypothetical protein [Saprospiraceae bacterium]
MKVAVFGTGTVGDTIGSKLIELGHTVMMGSRTRGNEKAKHFVAWCGIMVNPAMINGGDHNVFVCGNDTSAKEEVTNILTSFGWKDKNILDLGDITKARGTEMYLPLWLSIYGATSNGAFNIKLVS